MEGTVSGPITATIPASLRNSNMHFSLYVWNKETEARFDTIFHAPATSVTTQTAQKTDLPLFRFHHDLLVFSLPFSKIAHSVDVTVSVITLKGELIKAINLPFLGNHASLDVKSLSLSNGNYIIKVTSKNQSFSEKIYLLK
jgi:hypothetical protein